MCFVQLSVVDSRKVNLVPGTHSWPEMEVSFPKCRVSMYWLFLGKSLGTGSSVLDILKRNTL